MLATRRKRDVVHELLSALMICGCVVGLLASILTPQGRRCNQWIPMGVMLLAMCDLTSMAYQLLPDIGWAFVLMVISPIPVMQVRNAPCHMALHRAFSLVTMSALAVPMAAGASVPVVDLGYSHHVGPSNPGGLQSLVLISSIVFVSYSIVHAMRSRGQPIPTSPLDRHVLVRLGRFNASRVEAFASALAVTGMGIMAF
ncbi:UNVERIFIED_ORG: hypothetical protein J3D58_003620 [Paenarthrobacter nicotinovorans]